MKTQTPIILGFLALALMMINCSDGSFSGSSKSSDRTPSNAQGDGIGDGTPAYDTDFGDGVPGSGNNVVGSGGTINVNSGEATIPVNIQFQRFPDNAYYNNCVSITVGGDAPIEVGCNKDVTLTRTTTLQFKPKPHCNKISISMSSGGNPNLTTSNASSVRLVQVPNPNLAHFKGFMFYKESNDKLKGLVNDNGDDKNQSDTTFTLSGLSAIDYYIENTASNCN